MLEPWVNQAAGLQALALQHAPRLVAVASHGQQTGELPLLWGLCASWSDLGQSVLVLDAHAPESADNPGLAQWLNNPLQRAGDEDPLIWQVLPAARGLQRVHDLPMLEQTLSHLFKPWDIVLIYAPASHLLRVLAGSGLSPLIVVPPALPCAVSAYAALKLLLQGRLHPSVVNLVPEPLMQSGVALTASAYHLQQCAASFLGYHVHTRTVVATSQPVQAREDLQHLALDLFENALSLEQPRRSERVH